MASTQTLRPETRQSPSYPGIARVIEDPRRILLMIAGDIADVIRMTPHVKALRKRYPGAFIAALVSERGAAALQHCPDLDELIVRRVSQHGRPAWQRARDKLSHFLAIWRRLRGRFDLVIALLDLDASGPLWNVLAFCSGARWRIGYDIHGTGRLLTHNLGSGVDAESTDARMRRLLAVAGAIDPADNPYVEVWWTDDDDIAAARLLRDHGIDEDETLVALCPGSDWSCQQWDLAHWAVVGDTLATRYHARIVILGIADEAYLASSLSRRMTHQPIDLTGRTTLGQLACILRRCRLALTLESAPCAVALAVGTPTVALFGSIPVWIDGQNRAPAVGIRKCEGMVPTCFTLCKLAKMERSVHRCQSEACIGGDGLTWITPADVLAAAQRLIDPTPTNLEHHGLAVDDSVIAR